ncbi:hypothetical protein, partial [uncultured Muribaculum sp.]|uniref:hypothetical protein n=1 Tax=uncultured Muribaculum sp. TaxID=1918613 RepID=UPI00272F7B96
ANSLFLNRLSQTDKNLKYKFNDADALTAQAPANNINSKILGHKNLHISVVLRLRGCLIIIVNNRVVNFQLKCSL